MKIGSIVLCAGASKRMKSDKSKMLQDLCGRPLSFFAVQNALSLSDYSAVIVVGHQADLVKSSLDNLFSNLTFAYQKVQSGTADAVKIGLESLHQDCDTVIVLYGDTPLLTQSSLNKLVELHKNNQSKVTLLSAVTDNPYGYGRIVRNEQGLITAIVEEKEACITQKNITEINSGIYVFDVAFLRNQLADLDSNDGEYYLTDVVKKSFLDGHVVNSLLMPYEQMQGVNDFIQLSQARLAMRQRIINKHLDNGVDIIDPQNTYIDEAVQIGSNCVIYPAVHLYGNSQLHTGCIVEAGCIIKNSVIHQNTHVAAYSVIEQSVIEEACTIGPFARLRPQTHLATNVKIGNFVEVKKSFIDQGTKANHLAYIGDAYIGKNCNIAAGAITCNFDGLNKHKTNIKDNVFVGSNVTLIAPITIEKNSYLAASSCITDDVKENSLSIARAHQVNKIRK